ncbi:MAG: hypothetical protein ACOWW1_07390 [archaeon]
MIIAIFVQNMLRQTQRDYLNSKLQQRKNEYNRIDYDFKIRYIAKQELRDLALIFKRVESPTLDPETRNNQRFKILKEFLDGDDSTISDLIEGIVEACWDKAREIEEQRLVSTHGNRRPVLRQHINDPKALTPRDASRLIHKHVLQPIERTMAKHVSENKNNPEIKVETTFNYTRIN